MSAKVHFIFVTSKSFRFDKVFPCWVNIKPGPQNLINPWLASFRPKIAWVCIKNPFGQFLWKSIFTYWGLICSKSPQGALWAIRPWAAQLARFRLNGPFRFWSIINDQNLGTHEKKIWFLVKIGRSVAVFPGFPIFAFFDKFTFAVMS